MYSSMLFLLSSLLLFSCSAGSSSDSQKNADTLINTKQSSEKEINDNSAFNLDSLNLPKGGKITYFAKNVPGVRSLRYMDSENIVFAGSRSEGKVYALPDKNTDGKADTLYTLLDGLNSPNGVALKDGDLYVAEIGRIIRIKDIIDKLGTEIDYKVITDAYPDDDHHGWKYIAFGPDGMLYVPVGAPCNVCKSQEEIYATITRLDVETGDIEIMQEGIRNTVGFNWHPKTDDLWFTDNGRDWMGDNKPNCELNYAPKKDMHFGFPYCQGSLPDPKYGEEGICDKYVTPAQLLGPHVAPLGMEFISASSYTPELQNSILIAEHGSWNRSTPIGYRVSLVKLEGNSAVEYRPFIDGWLEGSTKYGRPVDLEWSEDQSLLISDDFSDVIYRFSM